MKNWLLTTWDSVRTSLWLIPAVMIAVGVGLAVATLQVDAGYGGEDRIKAWWLNSGNGEDARNLLSTLLTSTITMASLAFSVTALALSLAANTFGSRLIRTFRADLRTQFVLGFFALTIVYCIIVLRSVHGAAPASEVPHVSTTVGSALGLCCVLALLAFIQGIAKAISAEEVITRVRVELDHAISTLPVSEESFGFDNAELRRFPAAAQRIALPTEGYVQAVDYEGVVDWARSKDRQVLLDFHPGEFVVDGDLRVAVHPPTSDPLAARKELGAFILSGDERTPTQDVEFAIRHLVEIAVRALSTGVNDPFTAMAAVDRLRGGLCRLMARGIPQPKLADAAGQPRVWRKVPTFGEILDTAFAQIRNAAASQPAVLVHMLRAVGQMADHVRCEDHKQTLVRQARLIRAAGAQRPLLPAEQSMLDESLEASTKGLSGSHVHDARRDRRVESE